MPEGPEIRILRDRLAEALEGETAIRLEFHLPALQRWKGRFDGCRILRLESRGKALLTHLSSGYSLFSHNQLYGRWYLLPAGESADTKRRLRLAIHTRGHSALLYSASQIEVWPRKELHLHPFLSKLGPDVLDPDTRFDQIRARLLEKPWFRRQLGSLLTNQSFVAGVGNYLRCEILFVAAIHPSQRPCDLDDQHLERLARAILELPRRSYATKGITNELERAQSLMEAGATFEGARFHLYRREGKPCYRCGTAIRFMRRGGQGTYLCPGCQPTPA
ncbi:MAG TPA: endonuclease VIII [Chromatiaceae bacterium]|nr:endonuclease VIII [Chromatiaceae bacterium]